MRYAFVIDQSRCIGCHACSLGCKAEHDVPLGSYRTWVKYVEKGSFPDTRRFFTVLRCNHCELAPCVEICPVTALYRREDGIVDFDRDACIGCKACMQACPYDALYIHPDEGTAEKCNFCAHRVEIGLEPPCATVCPTEAIQVGDLDDPESRVTRITATRQVAVRKPEKGTAPKVFYVEGEPSALTPGAADPSGGYMWAEGPNGSAAWVPLMDGSGEDPEAVYHHGVWSGLAPARTVYDVAHERPWGWKVSAYLWTKSIAAGSFLVAAMRPWLGLDRDIAAGVLPIVGFVALGVTLGLLVADLKRPERFLRVLTRPNWDSWVARGAFILTAFALLGLAWTAVEAREVAGWTGRLRWPLVAAAVSAAAYSGYLFAQAKGRDFWQSSVLPFHLVVQAVVAGLASTFLVLAIAGEVVGPLAVRPLAVPLALSIALHLGLVVFGEVTVAHGTLDARRAAEAMTRGSIRGWYRWGMGLGIVALILITIAAFGGGWAFTTGAVLALLSLWLYEHAWLLAGQAVPLS
jgi:Fe-S-cluster-containing dehydrogenase component/formate-dependent nitrite reductase membrane component NrfD